MLGFFVLPRRFSLLPRLLLVALLLSALFGLQLFQLWDQVFAQELIVSLRRFHVEQKNGSINIL